jgi:diguanylate cyclase (GGDEF)-like protein
MDKSDKNPLKNSHHYLERASLNLFFLLTLFIIILINIGSHYQLSRFTAANELVIRTYQVIQSTNNTLLNMLDVETLTRGYLITNDASFIENLDKTINKIYYNLALAHQQTVDPLQKQKLQELEPLLRQQISLIKKSIELKKSHTLQTPEGLALLHRAQDLSSNIKAQLIQIDEKTFALLEQRDENALNHLHHVNIFIISTSVITLLIIFIGLLAINRQLSRQLFAENKLRKSEVLLKGIINGSTDLIAALDMDFRYIAFNHSYQEEFKRLFGKKIELGMNINDALEHLPKEREKIVEVWEKTLDGGKEFTIISEFGNETLSPASYEITCSSIRDDQGNLIGAAHIVRNIEKRLAAEKATIIANKKLKLAYQTLKEHDEGMSLLNQMDAILQTCATVEEALDLMISYGEKLFPFSAGVIYLTQTSGNYLLAKATWNDPQNIQEILSPDQCWALRQGKTYRFFNKKENIACKHYAVKDDLELYFCVPLLAQNDHIGLLYIGIKKSEHQTEKQFNQIADSHELIINNFAGLIALCIANIRLKDTLRIRSVRDPLTQLYNRAYLDEFLEREIHRAKRSKSLLAIIMLDIDHFKGVNDTFGHQAGDLILQTIGDLLSKQVRKSDIACRYGGEEFLLVLYDTSLNEAIERAEHLRKKISNMKFNFANNVIDSITASFGVALYSEYNESMEKLIREADQALYESKKMGRDRVTVYQKQP